MFSVTKGSETDLQANAIQLIWVNTLILQTRSSIMWLQYRVHVVNLILHNTKVEQCLGENYFRQTIIYSFGLLLRHVICTRPIYDLSQTNLDLDTFTTDL